MHKSMQKLLPRTELPSLPLLQSIDISEKCAEKIAKTYPATGYSQESNGVRRRQLTVKIGLIDCSKGRLSRQDTLYPVAKPPLSKKLSRIKAVHSLIVGSSVRT